MFGKEFVEIKVGGLFRLNGNDYEKRSTRTARMLSNGRTFYVGKNELVYPFSW